MIANAIVPFCVKNSIAVNNTESVVKKNRKRFFAPE